MGSHHQEGPFMGQCQPGNTQQRHYQQLYFYSKYTFVDVFCLKICILRHFLIFFQPRAASQNSEQCKSQMITMFCPPIILGSPTLFGSKRSNSSVIPDAWSADKTNCIFSENCIHWQVISELLEMCIIHECKLYISVSFKTSYICMSNYFFTVVPGHVPLGGKVPVII